MKNKHHLCFLIPIAILLLVPLKSFSQINPHFPEQVTPVCQTIYDLQTLANLSGRILAWDDGSMSFAWMMGFEEPAGFAFPDRGTGYNYFNGIEWGPIPESRIESVRTGWPCIDRWGPEGELVIAHEDDKSLRICRRPVKGSGPWEELSLEGPEDHGYLYPRIVTSGVNNEYLHLFALVPGTGNAGTPYLGQNGSLLYNRSADGGETWDIQHHLLGGIGADDYMGIYPDTYFLTSSGNTVVLIIGYKYLDLAMWKSTDNGETWEKTVIWEHPVYYCTLDSIVNDTLYTVDNSVSATIDKNNNVHLVWGITAVLGLQWPYPNYPYFILPDVDGIGYWNETMPAPIPEADDPFNTLKPENLDELGMLVGWSPDVNGNGSVHDFEGYEDPPFAVYHQHGVSSMPSIIVRDNFLLVAFSTVTETFLSENGQYNLKHIWLRNSYNLGQTWQPFQDVQQFIPGFQDLEGIYPLLIQQQGNFHLFFQSDEIPGLLLDENQYDESINTIVHLPVDIFVNIRQEQSLLLRNFSLFDCFPMPANDEITIVFVTGCNRNVAVEIFNLTGRKVKDIPAEYFMAGTHSMSVDVSSLKSGVYFYTVTAGNESVSKKLIVE